MRSLPSLRHLLPYKDPLILPHPQEREARSILDKYAFAADYLSGIGLNPNDIIDSNLADQYSPTFGDSETDGVPPPSGHGHGQDSDSGLIESGADAQSETTPSTSTGTGQWPLLDEVSGALDILYYGPTRYGTPPQTLTVDVDTGSADLWVPANCGNCHGHQFDAAHSSTFHPSNQDFSITYVGHFITPRTLDGFLTSSSPHLFFLPSFYMPLDNSDLGRTTRMMKGNRQSLGKSRDGCRFDRRIDRQKSSIRICEQPIIRVWQAAE